MRRLRGGGGPARLRGVRRRARCQRWLGLVGGLIAMFNFRTFTKLDWMGYGGAESFEDGRDPLLSDGDVVIDGAPADVIIDATGVSLNWWIDEEPYCVHVAG